MDFIHINKMNFLFPTKSEKTNEDPEVGGGMLTSDQHSPTTNSPLITFPSSHIWKCGHIQIDRHAALFFSQLGISLSIIALCTYNLIAHHDDCNNNQYYSGLLTMVIGIWTPSPKMKK